MKKRQRWGILFLAFLFIGILMAGGNYYIIRMQHSLWEQSISDVLEVTSQGGHALEVYIEKDMELVENLAKGLSQYDSQDEGMILKTLAAFDEENAAFTVVDLGHDVIYFNGENGSRGLSEEEREAYHGFSDQDMREPYLDERTGQKMISCYKRFAFADGTLGIVQKGQLISDVADEFSLSFYDSQGFSYIVNKQGDILIRSSHKNSNHTFLNILDVIELEGNEKESVEKFRAGLMEDKKGVARFRFDDAEHIFAFVPINNADGWYVISIIPDSAIMDAADQTLKTSQTILLVVGISVILFVFFIFLNRLYHKNVRAKEAEIQYREQLFNVLANNTDEVFLMLSNLDKAANQAKGNKEDYKLEYISPNVERVLGVPREDAKNDLMLLKGVKYSNGERVDLNTLAEISPDAFIVHEGERVHKKTGEHRYFAETVYRTTIDDNERFIVVLSDRTAERQSEAVLKEALEIAKTANESKSAFLSNMSHDIRTPMNAIVGLSTLLERDADKPEKVMEHTKKIKASSQHLLGLINDVLDMSKIESGKTTLNIEEISLEEILDEMRTIMRPQAMAKRQEFEITAHDIRTENLMGDKLRINQVLINLLSNAVKYTDAGGRVEMRVLQLPQITSNHARLRFVVKDNGIGMSPEYIKNVFKPFSREVNSVTNKVQGTGLGMAITKNLVDLMGGTISVESKLGEGSTFTVDLELRISNNTAKKPNMHKKADKKAGGEENTLKGRRFLIAEDNEMNAEILTELLDMLGVVCDVARNGKEAFEMYEKSEPGKYDVILMDVQMPVMNGYEATRAIRSSGHPKAKEVPIIALTANAYADDIKDAKNAGMNVHLAKPVDIDRLEIIVKELLDN